MMGTEPRRPTQESMTLSLMGIFLKGNRHMRTAIGLARNISTKQMNRPMPATGMSFDGKTSRPNVKNMTICISQAILS